MTRRRISRGNSRGISRGNSRGISRGNSRGNSSGHSRWNSFGNSHEKRRTFCFFSEKGFPQGPLGALGAPLGGLWAAWGALWPRMGGSRAPKPPQAPILSQFGKPQGINIVAKGPQSRYSWGFGWPNDSILGSCLEPLSQGPHLPRTHY